MVVLMLLFFDFVGVGRVCGSCAFFDSVICMPLRPCSSPPRARRRRTASRLLEQSFYGYYFIAYRKPPIFSKVSRRIFCPRLSRADFERCLALLTLSLASTIYVISPGILTYYLSRCAPVLRLYNTTLKVVPDRRASDPTQRCTRTAASS